jgi:uncharacterized protein involved in cysteine biosynthesis
MLRAIGRALSQLFDPALLGVVLAAIAAAVAVLLLTWVGVGEALAHVRMFETAWLDWIARISAGLTTLLLTLALFGAIAATIAGLLTERIARAVERRYYPWLARPRRQGILESLRVSLSFLLATLLLNLMAMPLYWIWGANLIIFLIINGYLLGREYFELVALRRVDRVTAVSLRRAYAARLLLAGMVIAAFSLLPLANLVTPVFATSFMLHIIQGLPELNQGLSLRPVR